MKLLALDTSTEMLSLAVQSGSHVWQSQQAGGAQSSGLVLPSILEILKQANLNLVDLDVIVYGCGPGSFTGVRTCCSVAQGLTYGANLRALPIVSLLAVAQQVRHEHGVDKVTAVLDARMQEVYTASYAWNQASKSDLPTGFWQCTHAVQVIAPEQLKLEAGYVIAGNALAIYPEYFGSMPHLQALPLATAMLQLAPQLLSKQEKLQTSIEIAPLYVRNKVAQTTKERELAKQIKQVQTKKHS